MNKLETVIFAHRKNKSKKILLALSLALVVISAKSCEGEVRVSPYVENGKITERADYFMSPYSQPEKTEKPYYMGVLTGKEHIKIEKEPIKKKESRPKKKQKKQKKGSKKTRRAAQQAQLAVIDSKIHDWESTLQPNSVTLQSEDGAWRDYKSDSLLTSPTEAIRSELRLDDKYSDKDIKIAQKKAFFIVAPEPTFKQKVWAFMNGVPAKEVQWQDELKKREAMNDK